MTFTKNDVIQWVEEIRKIADDDEAAHSSENRLYEEVLGAIARGYCDDPAGCAAEALKTQGCKFPHYCA